MQTLFQIKQDTQLSVQNYQVNMPSCNIHLLSISDVNITYLKDILLGHSQRPRTEDHAADDDTLHCILIQHEWYFIQKHLP